MKRTIEVISFDITYDDPDILPNNTWYVYVNIKVTDQQKKVHPEIFYTLACSSEYVGGPNTDNPVDDKTWIMDFLDKKYIYKKVEGIIKEANNGSHKSWQDYSDELKNYFYVDD